MKKYFYILFILSTTGFSAFGQIDSSYFISYDSTFNYYLFQPNISITVSELLNQNPTIFGISNNNHLVLNRVKVDESGSKHYKYKQYYNNINIEGTQFYIQANQNDNPISANGALCYDININTTPNLSSTQAIGYALNYANAIHYFWEDTMYENMIKETFHKPDTTYYPSAELVVINTNLYDRSIQPNYVLAYKIPIYSLIPFDSYYLFVDANNGNIVYKNQIMITCNKKTNSNIADEKLYDPLTCGSPCNYGTTNTLFYDWQNIYTEKYMYNIDCKYRLKDQCTYTDLYVKKFKKQTTGGNVITEDYRDGTNLWATSSDFPGTTALWCLERVDYFYKSAPYYRNSFDDNYSQINLIAERTWPAQGGDIGQMSFWTGTHIEIGDGTTGSGPFNNDMATLDIIGHEFTHGVILSSAGIYITREPGALNESFADIFGTMIDFYGKTNFSTGLSPNYLLGEECTSAGKLRDMSDPKSMNQPNTFEGQYWINPLIGVPTDANDYCGIHTNSGVQNYWFYLLSEGGSGYIDDNPSNPPYCVEKIGRDKAAKIAYKSLTEHLTQNAHYIDARNSSIVSAEQIYGPNSNEVAQVTQAWFAVGVGSAYNGIIELNNLTVSNFQTIAHNNEIVFNNLQVTPTGNLTVTSNTKIVMKPNSRTYNGSSFHAYIATDCIGGARLTNPDNSYSENNNYNETSQTLNKKIEKNELQLVPNPNTGLFAVQIINHSSLLLNEENEIIKSISIYDMIGKLVYQSENNKQMQLVEIDISNFKTGIYFIKVQSGNKIYTDKVIVE